MAKIKINVGDVISFTNRINQSKKIFVVDIDEKYWYASSQSSNGFQGRNEFKLLEYLRKNHNDFQIISANNSNQ